MTGERLIYLPLGGAGEVGMNLYVYGYGRPDAERLIVVDLGVAFPDMDGTPGLELIMADTAWLEERAERIEAIFITHAHEDHVGALGHLWPRLRAPVFARRFTAAIAERKLGEAGLSTSHLSTVGRWPETVTVGPFTVGFLPVAHSIPESAGLVIDTPAGRVIHSGDFKLDPTPGVGEPFDPALWAQAAAPGVRALVCDSTNVLVNRPGRSEAEIAPALAALIGRSAGLMAATTFASNVARLKTLADAAHAAGRQVVLLGRAMRTMVEVALQSGVLTEFPPTLAPEAALDLPRHKVFLLATGSQGERRAAMASLSRGKYLGFEMGEGDTVLFSSRTIPGNERDVLKVLNGFSTRGVTVIEDEDGSYHVSGHANRPDLARVHALLKPAMVIPMHGDHRMLSAHASLAGTAGIPALVAPNGTMVALDGPRPEVVAHVDAGRLYLDGTALIGAMEGVVRDRIRLALNGIVLVTLLIDERGEVLGDAWCELVGLPTQGRTRQPLAELLEARLTEQLGRATRKLLADEDRLVEMLKRQVRQICENEVGKKPEVTVVISHLES